MTQSHNSCFVTVKKEKKVKSQTETTRKQDRVPSHFNSSNSEPPKNSSASSGSTEEEDNKKHV